MNYTPKVAAVILNWNGKDDTVRCIESLKELAYPNCELIVIDNGSTDGSVDTLKDIKGINLIALPKNTGFTGGHIEGLRHSKGDFVALLNNDLVVDKNWLTELVNASREYKADIIGGCAYNWNQKEEAFNTGSSFSSYQTVNPVTGHTVMLHYGNKVTDANNLSGSNLLVSRKVIDRIGYLDNSFFAYYEETDFIARAKRAGFKAIYTPNAKVWHKVGASSAHQPFFFFYQMHRNRFRFVFKNYDFKYLHKFMHVYSKEFLISLNNNRKIPNNHDKAMVKAYLINILAIPSLLLKRRTIHKLGQSYIKKILLPSEGFEDVTVVVPCYNYSDYVVEALESLERQTLQPAHVIVINDGSTDDSADVITRFIDKKKRQKSPIKYTLINQENHGIIKTKNLALTHVDTNWMIFLDADDILTPNYIYQCTRRAREDNSDVVYTDMLMFGAVDRVQKTAKFNHRLLRSVNFIHNSALMKTSIFRESGGYKDKMSIGFEDWELYLTMSTLTKKFSYINEPIFLYRRHEGSSRDGQSQAKLPAVVKCLEELHPELYGLGFFWWLELYRVKGYFKEIVKLPYRLLKHSYHHAIIAAKKHPHKCVSRVVIGTRNKIKGNNL